MFVALLPATLLELVIRHCSIEHRIQMRTISSKFFHLISSQTPSLTVDIFYRGLGDLTINPHKLPIARKIFPFSSICVNLKGRELHYRLHSLDVLMNADEIVNIPLALLQNPSMTTILNNCSYYSIQMTPLNVPILCLNCTLEKKLRYIYLRLPAGENTIQETDTTDQIYRLVSSNNPRYSRAKVFIDLVKYVDDQNVSRLMKILGNSRIVVVNMESAPRGLAKRVMDSWTGFHSHTFTLKKCLVTESLKLYVHPLTKRLPFSSLSISGDILPLLDRIPIRVSSSVFSHYESFFTPQILSNIIHVEIDSCTLNDLTHTCLDCFIHIVEKCPHIRRVNWTLISKEEVHDHLYHNAEKISTQRNILMTYASFPAQQVCSLNDVCPI
ncbi:hypothetical protein GEMRC1_011367 [Eukaryota sp. GEM-RC1]